MSREEIGDAPVFREQAAATPTASRPLPQLSDPPPAGVAVDVRTEPVPARRVPRRVVVAALVVVTAASAGAGYARAAAATATGAGVTAAVVSAVRVATDASGSGRPARAMITVALYNSGAQDVQVDGYVADDSLGSGGFAVPRATVPARGRADLSLDVALRCDRPHELGVPGMRLRTRDRGGRTLQPVGAADALVRLCTAAAPVMKTLRAFPLSGGGDRLVINLGTQDGRPTRIEAVHAGSVPIDVGPLPARVGGAYALMLQPPAACPSPWSQNGFPVSLQVQIDGGRGPATVDVPVGLALARWAMTTSCSGSA